MRAQFKNEPEVIEDYDGFDGDSLAPLHIACIYGRADTARRLLAAGAPVDAPMDEFEKPALFIAATPECVRVLIDAGANLKFREKQYGATVLHWQSYCGAASCVRALLDAGIDPNVRGDSQLTALDVVTLWGVGGRKRVAAVVEVLTSAGGIHSGHI